jgi:predicted DNA-binding ribbon-helix-helix protein
MRPRMSRPNTGEERMCGIFAARSPETYAYQTRSIRLGGHSTSIRLEAAFWTILEEIAAAESLSLPKFLTTLHDEVLEFRGETSNFASLLRCACLTYVGQLRDRHTSGKSARAEAEFASSSSRPNGLEHTM